MNGDMQAAAAATSSTGAGGVLHAERRRQNIGLGDVSRHLKLSIRQVEALERDEFESFAGPVFVHGFIRNYAKLLGIDAAPLIEAADVKLKPIADENADTEVTEEADTPATSQRSNILLAGVAVVAVVAVAIYTTRNQEVSSPAQSSLEPLAMQTETEAAAPPESPQPMPDVAAAAPPPEVPAAIGNAAELQLMFDEESWVEVRDAADNVLFAQLNPAGARRSVSGVPPFSLVVGNAAGVRVWYQDREVDLEPHTRVDVARLTLE